MTMIMMMMTIEDIENENSILGYLICFCHSPSRLSLKTINVCPSNYD